VGIRARERSKLWNHLRMYLRKVRRVHPRMTASIKCSKLLPCLLCHSVTWTCPTLWTLTIC
jgi:hypothetical protein